MNASELAMLMLEWEEAENKASRLKDEIVAAVLKLKKTQNVGNVRATYSSGRRKYAYQSTAENHPMVGDATLRLFTTEKVDWKKVCNHAGIDDVPFEKSGPSVSVKLTE